MGKIPIIHFAYMGKIFIIEFFLQFSVLMEFYEIV